MQKAKKGKDKVGGIQLSSRDSVAQLNTTAPSVSSSGSASPGWKAILFSYGSFCPIHLNHVAMFEQAKQHLEQQRLMTVVAGVICPTADVVLKRKISSGGGDFVPATHRGEMCKLAVKDKGWIKVDMWTANNNAPAARNRQYLEDTYASRSPTPGAESSSEGKTLIISVLGADTLEKIGSLPKNKSRIVCVINRRYDLDIYSTIKAKGGKVSNEFYADPYAESFLDVIMADDGSCDRDFSSTLVRKLFREGASDEAIAQFLHPSVIGYIRKHNLFPVATEPLTVSSSKRPKVSLREMVPPALAERHIENEVQWDELQPETEGGEMRALGSGISSTIYAVRYKGQVVAAKVYDLPSQGPTKTLKFFFNEIDILSKTPPHDCIVKYFGAGVNYDIGKAFVVLELANRGSLSAFLTEYHGKTAKSKEVKRNKGREKDSKSELFALYGRAFLHTASGLQHLHEQGIIHRDLAITNVLVFENEKSELSFKIADFGLSQICWQSPLITIRGSMRNYAPEAIEQATKYVNASDVFMFGMLMYEVLEGKIPWEGQTTGAAIKQKMKGLRPAISAQNVQNFSTFVELMKQCWHQDSRQRPKAEDVVSALQEALIAEQPSTSSSSSKG